MKRKEPIFLADKLTFEYLIGPGLDPAQVKPDPWPNTTGPNRLIERLKADNEAPKEWDDDLYLTD